MTDEQSADEMIERATRRYWEVPDVPAAGRIRVILEDAFGLSLADLARLAPEIARLAAGGYEVRPTAEKRLAQLASGSREPEMSDQDRLAWIDKEIAGYTTWGAGLGALHEWRKEIVASLAARPAAEERR